MAHGYTLRTAGQMVGVSEGDVAEVLAEGGPRAARLRRAQAWQRQAEEGALLEATTEWSSKDTAARHAIDWTLEAPEAEGSALSRLTPELLATASVEQAAALRVAAEAQRKAEEVAAALLSTAP